MEGSGSRRQNKCSICGAIDAWLCMAGDAISLFVMYATPNVVMLLWIMYHPPDLSQKEQKNKKNIAGNATRGKALPTAQGSAARGEGKREGRGNAAARAGQGGARRVG